MPNRLIFPNHNISIRLKWQTKSLPKQSLTLVNFRPIRFGSDDISVSPSNARNQARGWSSISNSRGKKTENNFYFQLMLMSRMICIICSSQNVNYDRLTGDRTLWNLLFNFIPQHHHQKHTISVEQQQIIYRNGIFTKRTPNFCILIQLNLPVILFDMLSGLVKRINVCAWPKHWTERVNSPTNSK